MKDYYKEYNLRQKASTWRITRKIEKVIRQKIRAGASIDDELIALRILSSEYLRKIYDLKIRGRKIGSKPQILLDNATNPDDQSAFLDLKVFRETNFLAEHTDKIIFRAVGLDYIFSGLGYTPLGETLRPTGWRANNAAFISHFFFYFGIPLLLGALNPYLYWTMAPILVIKIIKEYKRAKVEYYQGKLKI